MFSDKREVIDSEKSSRSFTFLSFVGLVSFFAVIGITYFNYGTYKNTYLLSKNSFVCTKIEQIGKNMDDVVCVQYTSQKFYKEAVVLNKTAMAQ